MRSESSKAKIGHNSGNTSEDLDEHEIKKPVSAADLNYALVEIAKAEAAKKEASTRLRELSKSFVSKGGTKAALGIILRVKKMDPDDREAFFAELDGYGTFLRYW